jgi:superfamily II DNA helicase RecQ
MGKKQYHPVGSLPVAGNRLFTQFHAQSPANEREQIIYGLIMENSKLRVIFATIAFGIGLGLKNIRNVIHIGVPYTLEEYFQEASKAGRDGLYSKAVIHYNS